MEVEHLLWHSPTLSRRDKKPIKREWVKNHGQIPCKIKYHGLKNIGSSYKYIVKESPQRIPKNFRSFHKIFTFHLSPLFLRFFHFIPTVYVELSPYPLGSIPPFWKLLVQTNGEPNHGADGPFPQTAAVAYIIERYFY